MYVTTTANSRRPFSIKFNVAGNRTTYIGSFNAQWNAAGGTPSFDDYFERDIAAWRKTRSEYRRTGHQEGHRDRPLVAALIASDHGVLSVAGRGEDPPLIRYTVRIRNSGAFSMSYNLNIGNLL